MPKHRRAWRVIRIQWPRVYRLINHGKVRFLVDSRKTGFASGKREFWETEAEALASAEQIARQKNNEATLSFAELAPAQRRDAVEALALLDGTGATLLDAARTYIQELERERRLRDVPTVEEAVNAYINAKRLEEAQEEITRLTLREIESKMRIVKAAFADRKIDELDEATIRGWVRTLPHRPQGRKNILTKTVQFLNYAKREGKWITSNPAEGIVVNVKRGDVAILSVPEVERLLKAALQSGYQESVTPYLAVQLFGGLRPFEALRLRWEQIHFETEQIEVRAETSKTKESRYVELGKTLGAWLLPFRKSEGSILGPYFAQTLRTVKQKAGFTFGDDRSRIWPKDVLRHCYGSYWLPIHKDRAHLAELMGNSLQVIKNHYKRAIPESVACEFWRISPRQRPKIINMQAA
jgi:integrase